MEKYFGCSFGKRWNALTLQWVIITSGSLKERNLSHRGYRPLGDFLTECQDLVTSYMVPVRPGVSLVYPQEVLKCLVSNMQPVRLAHLPSKPQQETQLQPTCFHGASFTPREEVLATGTNRVPQIDLFLKSGIANYIPRNYIGNKIMWNLFLWTVAARSFEINPNDSLVGFNMNKINCSSII